MKVLRQEAVPVSGLPARKARGVLGGDVANPRGVEEALVEEVVTAVASGEIGPDLAQQELDRLAQRNSLALIGTQIHAEQSSQFIDR